MSWWPGSEEEGKWLVPRSPSMAYPSDLTSHHEATPPEGSTNDLMSHHEATPPEASTTSHKCHRLSTKSS